MRGAEGARVRAVREVAWAHSLRRRGVSRRSLLEEDLKGTAKHDIE